MPWIVSSHMQREGQPANKAGFGTPQGSSDSMDLHCFRIGLPGWVDTVYLLTATATRAIVQGWETGCDWSKAVKTCKRRVKNTTFTVANRRNVGRSWNYNGHSKLILFQSLEGNLGFLSTNEITAVGLWYALFTHFLMALECLRWILDDTEWTWTDCATSNLMKF